MIQTGNAKLFHFKVLKFKNKTKQKLNVIQNEFRCKTRISSF